MSYEVLMKDFPVTHFQPEASEYKESVAAFYTDFESSLSPAIVVRPKTIDEVSRFIKLAASNGWQVAIKGAGNTPWSGAANIEGGVMIDMRDMLGISIRDNEKTVSVSAGERWGSVFSILQAKGLATAGGRVSRVGVVGLTLGGGLSYFSGRFGFVCDSVLAFEVVLSTGEVVEASRNHHLDLFMALKGGSNNFGIVTRIEFPTFPQGIMWGGTTFYPGSVLPELCSTLVRFATNPDPDENANVLVSYGWAASVGMEMAVSSLYHGKPTELEEFPASLDTFVAIEPKLRSTIRKDSVLAFTEEQGSHSKDGSRSLYFTTSIKPDLEFLLQVRDIYLKAVEKVKDVQNLAFAIVMQPITKNFLQRSNQAGENAMGLRPEDGPMVNLMLNPVWEDAKDDERIIDLCLALIRKIDERALEDGKAVRWRFLNYGYRTQNVIESYGEERIQTLRDVSHKYDPSGFFQKNVPGGFKLPLS